MPENQEDSEPGIMPITDNAPSRTSTSRTVKMEDQDFGIHSAEALGQVDADFNNIALKDLEGADDRYGQAQNDDQADNAHVDW